MKIGVSFALLQEQLLAGEISRSAFLERASPLGTGTSEAAAVGDKARNRSKSCRAAGRSQIQLRPRRCSIGRSGFLSCATAD